MVLVVEQDVEFQSHDSGAWLLDVGRNLDLDAEGRLAGVHVLVFDRKPDFETGQGIAESVFVAVRDAEPLDVDAADAREIAVFSAEHAAVLLESVEELPDANAVELRRVDDVLPTVRRKEDLTICRQLNAIPRSGSVPTGGAGSAGR